MGVVLLLVLMVGATARITRLLVADSFPPIARARSWVGARGDWQDYLTDCPWCIGVWVAAAVTAAAEWRYSVPAPLLVWPTVAWAAAMLVSVEPHDGEGQ